jgi:transcriptional regulator with XRE-family HTH domain
VAKEQKSSVITEDELLNILKKTEFEFGKYLRAIREAKGISIRQLAKAVGKTPTYISDIEKKNNKPPEKKLLDDIILNLNLEDYSPKIKNTLYDLAAKERKDVPADIKDYIMRNPELLTIIRTTKDKPNDQQIWSQLLEKV